MKSISKKVGLNVLMLFAMLAWGGSWTSAKIIAEYAAPEVLVFWRFFFNSYFFNSSFGVYENKSFH
ncbi:MAG: hypothetical protein LRZ99_05310 [Desulfotomaculum sp.]|nr:hypothetical protein [Desulfotomaculum sp.]